MKEIVVAVAIIFNIENKILVTERAPHKIQGGRWEFPGGKVEDNETILSALKREIKEEVNLDIKEAIAWLVLRHHYPELIVNLHVWIVREYTGDARGLENQGLQWVSLQDLANLSIPDANRDIVDRLTCVNGSPFSRG